METREKDIGLLMGIGFLFEVMKMFWNETVVTCTTS